MPTPGWKPSVDLRVVALGLLLGTLCVYSLPRLLPWYAFLLPLPLCLVPWGGRWIVVSMLVGLLLASYQAHDRLGARLPHSDQSQDLWLSGQIADLPEHEGRDWRFLFVPDEGGLRRIRVTWYRSEHIVQAGECWRFLLRLKAPHGLLNPGGFDYEGWLFREGIGATGYVREAEHCAVDSVAKTATGRHLLLVQRQRLASALAVRLGEHPMQGFVLGLTLGEAGAITDAQWRTLRRTGTTHLISISGLHITLAAGFVFFIARWLWSAWPRLCLVQPAQRIAAFPAIVAAIAYALLAGFSIPTQRALVMLLVVMTALLLSRRLVPSRLLALAMIAVLVYDPIAALYPGFWLSFGAVAWLLYSMAARLGPIPRWQVWLQPQWVLALALVPACLFWFGEFSLVSPAANLVMIPVFSLLIPWLLASVALLDTLPGDWMLALGVDFLGWVWLLLAKLGDMPYSFWSWQPPTVAMLAMAVLGLMLLMAPRGVPAKPMGLILCLPMALPGQSAPPHGHLDFALLDVGQGLAAVIRTQNHVLLYDTGPAFSGGLDTGETVVLPYLRQLGLRQIDTLVLSHADIDHRGGLDAVRMGIPVRQEIGTDSGIACTAGMGWQWDGIGFEILHPPDSRWTGNDGSCVLRITAGAHALLLTGDIQSVAEQELLWTVPEKLAADVVVVPHHGSRSSSGLDFVSAVQPDLALVPAGWANRWGFPKPDVSARYEASGARIEVTGIHGALQFRMCPEHGVEQLTRWREQSRRLWRAG